jgi:hypothetical protein
MSDIRDLTVKELIHILQGTHRAIDLRAMLLREGAEWNCIFFVLRMTIQDQSKLNSSHDNKIPADLPTPDVQILYESRESADINTILAQIDNRRISIGGYTAKSKRVRIIEREKTKTITSYTMSEDVGFPHKVITVPYDPMTTPLKRLESHGVKASDFNLRWLHDIKSCFDVGNLYDPYYLIFAFPVYVKVLECLPNKLDKKLILKFEIHDILLSPRYL